MYNFQAFPVGQIKFIHIKEKEKHTSIPQLFLTQLQQNENIENNEPVIVVNFPGYIIIKR